MLPVYNSAFLDNHTSGVDAFAQDDYMMHVNYCHPPIAVIPRLVTFLSLNWPRAKCIIIFPYWTAQAWFLPMCKLCNAIYFLPATGNALFEKAHAFPATKMAKNESWQYLVGYMNLPILNPPNLHSLMAAGN